MFLKKILHLLSLVLVFQLNAQVYDFSITTGTYSDLTNTISLNGEAPWDDPEFAIPIGFDFQYFDTVMTTIYIDDAGFGASLTSDPNEVGILPILTPYGGDIIDRAYDFDNPNATTGSVSTISYVLEGTTGSRVLKIEWNNVGFHSEIDENETSNNFTNFQMWLYEESNDIEIHFGPNNITDPDLVFDGDTGTSVSLIEGFNFGTEELDSDAITLIGDPSNPSVNIVNNTIDLEDSFLDGVIPNGTVYRFSSSSLSIQELNTAETNITLYPNPAENYFSISSSDFISSAIIYDINGRIVKTLDLNKTEVDVSNISSGVYIVKLQSEKGQEIRRLIKK